MQKDLANANISETKLLWFELPSDASIKIHMNSSATWSWCKCYFEPVSNALFWVNQGVFHLIHEKIKKTTSYGICLLGCDYLYLMPCSSFFYLHIDIAWFKVQRKSGFLYDILVYWIASHWSDLFNS